MIRLITLGLPALLVAAALFWIRPRRDGQARPAHSGSTITMLLAWAVAIVGFHPGVQDAADDVTRDLAKLVSNVLMLVASVSVVSWLMFLNHEQAEARRRLRPRLAFLGAAVTVMTVAFFAVPADRRWSSEFTNTHWGQAPILLHVYTLAYVLVTGHATYDCLAQTWRRSSQSPWRVHRAGLRGAAIGCFFVLLYLAYKVVNAGASIAGVELFPGGPRCTTLVTPFRCSFSFTAPLLGVLLITAGLTVPALLWPAAKLLRRRWERKTAQDLLPLWTDVTAVRPQVVLRAVVIETDPDVVLHRRVVEVCDGILDLDNHRSRAIQRMATEAVERRGQAGTATGAAIVEAAVVAAAIEAARTGARDQDDPAPQATGESARAGDLRAEALWLRSVSQQYATNDIVRTAVAVQRQAAPTATAA
ncbi:MAB_1171c family putative transporter [Kitasatospora sp. MBT63]|uniref:MAB_1171c family putative transporter n=1 Tax=Kitasatospora sp. MBT63 TaxID=1444768 RepID=UPI0011EA6A3E|nr:MAB_1171c family putative transporter [Kitasatospora sp. MBT63]